MGRVTNLRVALLGFSWDFGWDCLGIRGLAILRSLVANFVESYTALDRPSGASEAGGERQDQGGASFRPALAPAKNPLQQDVARKSVPCQRLSRRLASRAWNRFPRHAEAVAEPAAKDRIKAVLAWIDAAADALARRWGGQR